MQSLTNNVIEIELFGKKLLLSERTARDVNALQKYASEGKQDNFDGMLQSAIIVRDGLKINLLSFESNPVKWWQLNRKKEYRELISIITAEKILSLPIRLIIDLSGKVLELEGVDVEALKKKMTLMEAPEREGLAVTLQTESSVTSST